MVSQKRAPSQKKKKKTQTGKTRPRSRERLCPDEHRHGQVVRSAAMTETMSIKDGLRVILGVPSISILSWHPSFQKTTKSPGETAGFRKERWLKRMGNQPLQSCCAAYPTSPFWGSGTPIDWCPIFFLFAWCFPLTPSTKQVPKTGCPVFFQGHRKSGRRSGLLTTKCLAQTRFGSFCSIGRLGLNSMFGFKQADLGLLQQAGQVVGDWPPGYEICSQMSAQGLPYFQNPC